MRRVSCGTRGLLLHQSRVLAIVLFTLRPRLYRSRRYLQKLYIENVSTNVKWGTQDTYSPGTSNDSLCQVM